MVLCSAASAQEVKPSQAVLPPVVNANSGAGKMMAHELITPQQLAACWALDNQEEIVMAKFAIEKSNNKDVAEFAKMMVDEHQGCLKKLSKFAPEASREGYLADTGTGSNNQSDKAGTAANRASEQPNGDKNNVIPNQKPTTSGKMPAGIDMTQLQLEIAQQCVADSKKYLNGKDDADFDKCFVGMQIAKHASMHTKLIVLQRHVGSEMQPMVTEGIQAMVKHIKAAESLMAKLDSLDAKVASK
jgi:predicted outer membrane protein